MQHRSPRRAGVPSFPWLRVPNSITAVPLAGGAESRHCNPPAGLHQSTAHLPAVRRDINRPGNSATAEQSTAHRIACHPSFEKLMPLVRLPEIALDRVRRPSERGETSGRRGATLAAARFRRPSAASLSSRRRPAGPGATGKASGREGARAKGERTVRGRGFTSREAPPDTVTQCRPAAHADIY
ncbi:hypothetical protein AAFF_G00081890 [Aldrovandia affinis]|uniref:Uncharacterized protein n=1 Tax=Aldrovandia affinis TaxID=143900 RepID=A0AAD7WYC4_9TELE|nr:hypothetical protein AAFF_G00081890 [Aldrovandia affinis]